MWIVCWLRGIKEFHLHDEEDSYGRDDWFRCWYIYNLARKNIKLKSSRKCVLYYYESSSWWFLYVIKDSEFLEFCNDNDVSLKLECETPIIEKRGTSAK